MVLDGLEAYFIIPGKNWHHEQEEQVHDKPENVPHHHQVVLADQLVPLGLRGEVDIVKPRPEASDGVEQDEAAHQCVH